MYDISSLRVKYVVGVEGTASFTKHRTARDSDQNYVDFASDTRQNPLYSFRRTGKYFEKGMTISPPPPSPPFRYFNFARKLVVSLVAALMSSPAHAHPVAVTEVFRAGHPANLNNSAAAP